MGAGCAGAGDASETPPSTRKGAANGGGGGLCCGLSADKAVELVPIIKGTEDTRNAVHSIGLGKRLAGCQVLFHLRFECGPSCERRQSVLPWLREGVAWDFWRFGENGYNGK